jgi:twitching motility protein PilT
MAEIDALFKILKQHSGSDLHLSPQQPPMLRINGELRLLGDKLLTHEHNQKMIYEIMDEGQRKTYEDTLDLDFAYEVPELDSRFRANIFCGRLGISAVFRLIPSKIMTAEELGLSAIVLKLTEHKKGLVLVTGPTGSGKSTTLAAMVDHLNKTQRLHILTIEDPVEFVHKSRKSLVNHREVGKHTRSFSAALKASLREDPDVILVGEMRDLETIELAITAAETGHLVFGTLHTSSASKTIDRIINVFPTEQQEQIRVMLAESLKGVIAQQLLKSTDGKRCAALEILIGTSATSNLIREGKTFQLPSIMQIGRGIGMQLMDQALVELVNAGKVDQTEAVKFAVDKALFQ